MPGRWRDSGPSARLGQRPRRLEDLLTATNAFVPSEHASSHDETALAARIRSGDETAFETLYRAHHDALWKFAFGYVRARDVAEELVQEVFLALWRDRERLDPHGCSRAWLYAATRNQALKHLRHERVVTQFRRRSERAGAHPDGAAEGWSMMSSPAPDAHSEVEARELDDAVAGALATLPERRKVAMTLSWKHGLTAAEIAEVLGTSPGSVRVLLTRARQELVALLGRVRGAERLAPADRPPAGGLRRD